MKRLLILALVVIVAWLPWMIGALDYSADNYRATFGNGYAWGGHVPKDRATEWAQDVESGVRSLTAAGNGPSPLIWNNCPFGEYSDGVGGSAYFSDLQGNHTLAANQSAVDIGENVAGFTGATGGTTLTMATDEPIGSVIMSCTTDNETIGVSVLCGTNTVGNFVMTSGKQTWFECRVKGLTVGNDEFGMFVGFAEEALLSEDALILDTDLLADVDLFGFHRLAADGDQFDTTFGTNGASPTTLQADTGTTVADTYVKLGFYCDGTTVTPYKDGVALTATTLATSNFPDTEEMAVYIVMATKGGNDEVSAIDWIRVAREY